MSVLESRRSHGSKCGGICGRRLDQESEPKSLDCGGDCLGCVEETDRMVDALSPIGPEA